jgi:small-conductance mechanosensitive channel
MEYVNALLETPLEFIASYKASILITLFILIAQYLLFRVFLPRLEKAVEKSRLKEASYKKAKVSLSTINLALMIFLITFVWGFDFKGMMTVSASIIALLGVSLFAGWSLLSNVTAFFLLIFHSSFQRGNFIRIIQADNYIEGYISEINLFNTKLISEDKEVMVYPNNLLILNPSIINPKKRYSVAGKISDFDE